MNKQVEIPGTEKTGEQKLAEIRTLKNALAQAASLPTRTSDMVKVLDNASPEDLVAIASLCATVSPRIRALNTITNELLAR